MADEYQDFNVPDGTPDNMTAGQAVVFGDLITGGDFLAPGVAPTTCLGYIKLFKLLKNGVPLIFKQGMPLEPVNEIEMEQNVTMSWEGYEWNLDLFQMLNGNEAVNEAIEGSKYWGIGGNAVKAHSKFLVFHKLLDGRFVWINVWNAVPGGEFNLEFMDDDWMKTPFLFNLHKGLVDFDDVALTKNYLYRIEETNLPCP